MSTVLLVEDNPDIMKINYLSLMMEGYEVKKATTVAECLKIIRNKQIDIIILDILLPDGSGIDLCTTIKRRVDVPIIFLSALGENGDVISALKAGGDCFLTKPCDIDVLIAQVEAGLRTVQRGKSVFLYEKMEFNTVALRCFYKEEDLLLTQKEFFLLLQLAKCQEQYITKEHLFEKVWGHSLLQTDTTLYSTISRINKKLESCHTGFKIFNDRCKGYILEKI